MAAVGCPSSWRRARRPSEIMRPTCAGARDRAAITITLRLAHENALAPIDPKVVIPAALAQDFGVSVGTAAERIQGTRLSADSSASWHTDPVPRTLGRPGPASRPSAGAGRHDADPEGASAPPNRRPRPMCISLTSDGDKGIAKTSALSHIDHMRSIANQLYALLHPRPTLRWQPGNAACREAPSEGPR